MNEELTKVLRQLTNEQLRFVRCRLYVNSDKKACEETGLSPSAVYHWRMKGIPIDEAVQLIAMDSVHVAREMLRRAAADAASSLRWVVRHARKPSDRIEAAVQILDRIGLQARKGVDVAVEGPWAKLLKELRDEAVADVATEEESI